LAALGVVLHDQGLADLEVFAAQLVPALQILHFNLVGLGDGAEVVTTLRPLPIGIA
jgi:hypothetical protein